MSKTAKKTKAKTEPVVNEYRRMLALLEGGETSLQCWVLRPTPIPRLSTSFEQVVLKARVQLIHEKWETVGEAVRELSDWGGVLSVDVVKVMRSTRLSVNSRWVDGKQVRR